MSFEARLKELGLQLPAAPKPVAAYVPAVKTGDYVYTSGQLPFVDGELKYQGKAGGEVSEKEAYEAAKICAVNCLSVIRAQVGSLDRIGQVVKITGYVNSVPGFHGQSKVLNGASELMGQIFGQAGHHARSAVGVSELPLGAVVEVEMLVKVLE